VTVSCRRVVVYDASTSPNGSTTRTSCKLTGTGTPASCRCRCRRRLVTANLPITRQNAASSTSVRHFHCRPQDRSTVIAYPTLHATRGVRFVRRSLVELSFVDNRSYIHSRLFIGVEDGRGHGRGGACPVPLPLQKKTKFRKIFFGQLSCKIRAFFRQISREIC